MHKHLLKVFCFLVVKQKYRKHSYSKNILTSKIVAIVKKMLFFCKNESQ